MADIKFSQFSTITNYVGTDIIVGLHAGVNAQGTLNQLLTFTQNNIQITESQVTNLISDLASKLNLSGGTMTGNLIINANLSIGTSTVNAPLTVQNSGGTTYALATNAYFGSVVGATAGNFYQITIAKGNFEAIISGINKNSNTGNIGANYAYFSTFSSSGGLALAQGDNAGLPATANLLINGSGQVNIPNSLSIGSQSISSNALLQLNSTTKGFLPSVLNNAQESTLTALLASGDAGLFWYNSTVNVPTYWDGLDRQQILTIDNIIQGSNMIITNNGDGTVTFASSGGSSPGVQVNGSFTVVQSTSFPTPLTSSFTAVGIDPSKFTAVHQSGVSVTTATINSVSTPIIINTSSGGTRWCKVTYDLGIAPSNAAGQTYTFCIAIQRNGGPLQLTSFNNNITIPSISTASGFKPISISGEVDLNTNDYVYLTIISDTASQPVAAYYFNAELIDTTVAGIPTTDALSQGSSNLYLSQNGGTTYENISGTPTIGNLAKFNTNGGQLIDSGILASNVITTSTTAGGDLSGTYPNPTVQQVNVSGTAVNANYFLLFSSAISGSEAVKGDGGLVYNPFAGQLITTYFKVGTFGVTPISGFNPIQIIDGVDSTPTYLPVLGFFTSNDSYPLMDLVSFTHGTNSLNFEAYYDNSGVWRSSYSGSNFQIQQLSNALNFNYDSGIAQGSSITWGNALSINTLGQLKVPTLTANQAVVTNGSQQLSSLAYTNSNTANTLVERDSSGNFSAGTITAALNGNASTATSATTATNANNVATTSTSTNASFFPLFVASSSNSNQAADLGTGLTFNPSTNTLTTTTFSGALSGNATTATTATNANNVATTQTTTNATYYPLIVASSTNSNQSANLNTSFTYNPNTGVAGVPVLLINTTTKNSRFTLADPGSSINTPIAYIGSVTGATGGNFYSIQIDKAGSESLYLGLNKNSTTGQVPSNAVFISTYTSSGQLSIGRGGSNGQPNNADILIDGSGNVSVQNGKLGLKTGTNGCRGSVTLSGTSTTINTTSAATGNYIGISNTGASGTTGTYTISISNGISFTITPSTGALDTSTLQWFIMS